MNYREEFTRIARSPICDEHLARIALLISAEHNPTLDIDHYMQRFCEISVRAQAAVAGTTTEWDLVSKLNRFFFEEEGFLGNQADYYDPRNSFLNEVLERRTGIPITLGIMYIEIGRQLGLSIRGINFPAHFLVQYHGKRSMLIDPFFGGVVTEQECQERVRSALGDHTKWRRAYLRPASPREIVVRLLTNLKFIYLAKNDLEQALVVCERLLILKPDTAVELRDRGLIYQEMECYVAAERDFTRFLELAPNDPLTGAVQRNLAAVRQQISHFQ